MAIIRDAVIARIVKSLVFRSEVTHGDETVQNAIILREQECEAEEDAKDDRDK